jgi:hypothetical protein
VLLCRGTQRRPFALILVALVVNTVMLAQKAW